MHRDDARLTVQELVDRFGVSRRTIFRMRKDGRIPVAGEKFQQRAPVSREFVEAAETSPSMLEFVKVPRHVWLVIVATLPNATPENVHAELRGALRAAALLGGTGSTLVEVDED